MKDKLSIQEFAELSGKSRQAIYKQVNKKLSPYVSTIDNQRMIDSRALKEVYGIEVDNQGSKQGDNQETTDKLIELLQKELENKDKQIEQLHQLLAREQELLKGANDRVLELEDKMAAVVKPEQETEPEPISEPIKKSWWQFWK